MVIGGKLKFGCKIEWSVNRETRYEEENTDKFNQSDARLGRHKQAKKTTLFNRTIG